MTLILEGKIVLFCVCAAAKKASNHVKKRKAGSLRNTDYRELLHYKTSKTNLTLLKI